MTDPEDLYETLQVHPSAHQAVIDATYQRLAELYHPSADPSPEAAAMLGAIGRAYAVLGDPEQRAAYDQSRADSDSAAASQGQDAPTQTDPQKPRSRHSAGKGILDYITIGSTKDDVTRIQGPPNQTSSMVDIGYEGEVWRYWNEDAESPNSPIHFNKAGRVDGWSNGGNLNVRIVPGLNVTTSESFSIGSHKDDVARLQGTPSRVTVPTPRTAAAIREEREHRKYMRELDRELGKPANPEDSEPVGKFSEGEDPDRETWHFTGGIVEFSIKTGRVVAWETQDGALKVQQPERDVEWTGEEYFTLGSNESTVKRVQGEPSSKIKKPLGTEIWRYRHHHDKVEFMGGRVLGWSNIGRNLKVRVVPGPNITSSPIFSLGSYKDDVARLQGTPHGIDADKTPDAIRHGRDYEVWHYRGGNLTFGGSVTFSTSGRVIDWSNPEGVLKVHEIRPDPWKAKRLADRMRREKASASSTVSRTSTSPKAQGSGCLLAMLPLFAVALAIAAFLT